MIFRSNFSLLRGENEWTKIVKENVLSTHFSTKHAKAMSQKVLKLLCCAAHVDSTISGRILRLNASVQVQMIDVRRIDKCIDFFVANFFAINICVCSLPFIHFLLFILGFVFLLLLFICGTCGVLRLLHPFSILQVPNFLAY